MTVEQLVLSCRNELKQVWIFDQSGNGLVYGDEHDGNVKEYFDYEVAYFELEKVETIYDVPSYDLDITVEV